MYLVNLRSGWKLWWSVLFSIMLIVGWAIVPAQAHCDGKHAGNHPHCTGGGGGGGGGEDPPVPNFDPEIVYYRVTGAGAKRTNNLVVADATVSNTHVVFDSPNLRFPSWSPDGTEVLFIDEVDGQWGIYRLSILDGQGNFSVGDPTPIISVNANSSRPRWSPVPAPDGKYWIAYSDKDPNSDKDLYLVNPDDANEKIRLTNTPGQSEYHPTWSPTGNRIGFLTAPNDVACSCPGDVEIIHLTSVNGSLVVPVPDLDRVSLVVNNPFVGGEEGLADQFKGTLFWDTDWANTGDWILTNDGPTPWVFPTTQEDVPNANDISSNNPDLPIGPRAWSPNDEKILGTNGACSDSKKVHTVIAIGTLVRDSSDTPDEIVIIDCNEKNLSFSPEWWRGGGTP